MSDDVELFITTESQVDHGKVTEVEDDGHSALGVYFQEPFSEHELGMIIHYDEIPPYHGQIVKGDDIEVEDWGQQLPPKRLTVNGTLFYDRTDRQRQIIAAVRQRQNEIAVLMQEYSAATEAPLAHEIAAEATAEEVQ